MMLPPFRYRLALPSNPTICGPMYNTDKTTGNMGCAAKLMDVVLIPADIKKYSIQDSMPTVPK